MLDVFLLHSRADREAAALIGARLEDSAEALIRLEECDQDALVENWEEGSSAAAILLLISSTSVPEKFKLDDWHAILKHREQNRQPPIGVVRMGTCRSPQLLERKHFFRWDEDPTTALRDLSRWVMTLHGRMERHYLPARLPWFSGRETELGRMWRELVDECGVLTLTGHGKTALAQEFARTAGAHFRDVLWVECADRSEISIAGDLAAQLQVSLGTVGEDALSRVGALIQERRVLVVFDDVPASLALGTVCGGRASILITARSRGTVPLGSSEIELGPGRRPEVKLANLIPACRQLWEAMQTCRRQGFPLALAGRIAKLDPAEVETEARSLVEQRWIDPVDAAGTRFRLAARGEAKSSEAMRRRHAEAVAEVFSKWRAEPALCQSFLAEMESAVHWAIGSQWRLATMLAHRAFAFLKNEGRVAEAIQLYEQILQAATDRNDLEEVEECSWELSWFRDQGTGLRRPTENAQQIAFDF